MLNAAHDMSWGQARNGKAMVFSKDDNSPPTFWQPHTSAKIVLYALTPPELAEVTLRGYMMIIGFFLP